MNPYANSRIYGPYKRLDGRMHVICIFPDSSRKTVSYPRFLVETSMGRVLETYEEVHHINSDFTDNRLENLEIINKRDHAKMHIRRLIKQDFLCPVCGCEFWLDGGELSNILSNRKRGKSNSGPYCSRSCAGVGSTVRSEIKQEYTSLLSQQEVTLAVDTANSEEPVIDGNAELN